MYSANHWGGSFEIATDGASEDDDSGNMDLDPGAVSAARQHRHELDETQQGWLLGPPAAEKKNRHVDLGCVVVKRKVLWWAFWGLAAGFVIVGLPVIVSKSIPRRAPRPPPPDQYAEALRKALLFFNAQKCEHCPRHSIPSLITLPFIYPHERRRVLALLGSNFFLPKLQSLIGTNLRRSAAALELGEFGSRFACTRLCNNKWNGIVLP